MAGAQGEILAAERLFSDCGGALPGDETLGPLLERYTRAIQNTCALMEEQGVSAACADCASGTEGGCCFCGVEEWYDPVLLLINLLLGVRLPLSRDFDECCFFVGPGGCKLRAKHSFCLNYLCPALKGGLRSEAQTRLLSVIGQELLCGWELERGIHLYLRRHGIQTGTDGDLPCNSGSPEA